MMHLLKSIRRLTIQYSRAVRIFGVTILILVSGYATISLLASQIDHQYARLELRKHFDIEKSNDKELAGIQNDNFQQKKTFQNADDSHSNLSDQRNKKIKTRIDDNIKQQIDTMAGKCDRKPFGNVSILVAFVSESYKTHYKVAQQTLMCYVNRTKYPLIMVDLYHDERVKQHCKHDQLFFRKHCAASVYLTDSDWMLVLDADTGIINPNHCIEEYIDSSRDVILYERFFNWEIASGNYLVKNTEFSRKFLMRWANYQYKQPNGFTGADNGALQLHVLRTILPEATEALKTCNDIWSNATTYESYMYYVTCCKVARGAKYAWDEIKIFRRAHGWVQDWFITGDKWCSKNFMFHGYKANEIGAGGWNSPFTRVPVGEDCVGGAPWPWRKTSQVDCKTIANQIRNTEKGSANGFPKQAQHLPYLTHPDVGDCWPSKCGDA